MKTAIFLIGNVCAGKSTLAQAWANAHPQYQVIDLDTIRQRIFEREKAVSFSTGMEREAQAVAMDMVQTHHHIIFPSLGISEFFKKVLEQAEIRFERVATFTVFVPAAIALPRIQNRIHQEGFRPHAFATDPMELFRKYDHSRDWEKGKPLLFGMANVEENVAAITQHLQAHE